MNTSLQENNIIKYQENAPKLQWLIALIPILGAFIAYDLIRKYKPKKKKPAINNRSTIATATNIKQPYNHVIFCSPILIVLANIFNNQTRSTRKK
jgi:hypothetical protein